MRINEGKWWLTFLALLLLVPIAPAGLVKPKHKHPPRSVPEGGSALVYVLGAGVTCLGAMVVRSRSARPKQL